MTQPPYGGPSQPPSGPPPQQDPWQQSAPPPPYGQPTPPAPPYGQPGYGQPSAQPYGPPYGEPPPAAPAAPYGSPVPNQSWPDQPPPRQQFPVDPYPSQPVSGQPVPGQPVPGAEFGQSGYPPGQPGYPPYGAPPPKKKRVLLIVSLSLVIVLLLCGGGGVGAYLLLRDTEPNKGAAEPVAAVEDFLEAVYRDKDANRAASLVCSEARDKVAIKEKVAEIEKYETTYPNPRYRWDKPEVDDQNDERALVSVELNMITSEEKIADQKLVFTVVQKTGWWVCEVS